MKKILTVFSIIILLICLSTIDVNAEENFIYDLTDLYNSLSDGAKQSLQNIGAESADANVLSNISFNSIINEISNIASQNISTPLKGLITITAILLICSILSAYKSSLSNDISTAINIVSTLCIVSAIVVPAISVINNTSSVIETSSNLMLAYIPVVVAMMSASGHIISSGSYYATMIATSEGIAQLSSKVIIPFLNMFLGISITSGITPDINLSGFTNIISKTVKWLLGFSMAIFTTVLSLKQIINTSLDGVSSKAVKFALSSFIPIVGSALSDAYKTVQGSIGVLKSGVGVFVILSIAVIFLPVVIQSVLWIATLWIGKLTAEVLILSQTAKLLECVISVFSTLLGIVLCIMSIYIISTALVLVMGGGG